MNAWLIDGLVIVVYFIVFAAGSIYILRLMAASPHHGEQGPSGDMPARAP